MKRILIALDDSPIARRAAREAGRLFGESEYIVVNVKTHTVPWVSAGEFGTGCPAPLIDSCSAGLADDVLTERAKSVGVKATEVVHGYGDAANAICEAAEAHDVDAIVMGSRDKGAVRRLIDPSVAHAVVRGTNRPVVVVSGKKQELRSTVNVNGDPDRIPNSRNGGLSAREARILRGIEDAAIAEDPMLNARIGLPSKRTKRLFMSLRRRSKISRTSERI